MAKKDEATLEDAINAAIDARLKELGLLEKKGGKKGKDADDDEVDMDALKAVAKKLDKADLKKVLKKLKVEKLSEIDDDDLEAAMKLLKKAAPDDDDDEIDMDKLKEKFVELVNEKGKPEAKKLLKKLKVDQLAELDEDDFEKAMTLLKKALGEEGGKDDDNEDLFGD